MNIKSLDILQFTQTHGFNYHLRVCLRLGAQKQILRQGFACR